MKSGLGLIVAGTALAAGPASAQHPQSHSVFIACKIDPGSNAPVHYSPIGKATIPWLPRDSSSPGTVMIIASSFRDVVVNRGIKYYKAECFSGTDVKQVRAGLANAANSGETRLEMPAASFWTPLVEWMVGLHNIHRTTAAQYIFEPVESVAPGMKPSTLF